MKIKVCNLVAEVIELELEKAPTTKQLEIIKFIESYKMEHKCVPDLVLVTQAVGATCKQAVFDSLKLLKKKGYDYRKVNY